MRFLFVFLTLFLSPYSFAYEYCEDAVTNFSIGAGEPGKRSATNPPPQLEPTLLNTVFRFYYSPIGIYDVTAMVLKKMSDADGEH